MARAAGTSDVAAVPPADDGEVRLGLEALDDRVEDR
jgi:hypothetical protein